MRRTKEEAAVTHQTLLKAALAVFSRQGYADTRLEDIAAEAGVTRGAIYHHFGGKAELYNALVSESSARVMPAITQALNAQGSVIDVLRQVFVQTLVYAEQDDDFRAVNELVLFKTAMTPELAEGIKRKREGTRHLVDVLAEKIQAGKRSGEIRASVNARDAALALLGLQNGLLSLWLMDQSLFSLKRRAEGIADVFLNGIAAG